MLLGFGVWAQIVVLLLSSCVVVSYSKLPSLKWKMRLKRTHPVLVCREAQMREWVKQLAAYWENENNSEEGNGWRWQKRHGLIPAWQEIANFRMRHEFLFSRAEMEVCGLRWTWRQVGEPLKELEWLLAYLLNASQLICNQDGWWGQEYPGMEIHERNPEM